ncbi:DUF6443 domain-containing protein [Chryseobacterium sp. 'Rf worker isolate 10']|uniref:DUF6443 domain-containing protein n=1 Tax=Chryseobacterium sp. 'Rf worker isolate 10' TaxID=2887348 RepID=UPI003D6F9D63
MKNIFIALSVFVIGQSYAQTATENYIQSREYLEPVTNTNITAKQIETVQYFDGLGRPKQTVNVKASPLRRDVVNHIEYDGFGRQIKEYLPVPQSSTQNGNFYSNPLTNATQPDIYGSEKIYSEIKMENSPIDRIQQKINVGTDWSGKPVKFSYSTNSDSEVRKYYATPTTWQENKTNSTLKVADNNSSNGFYLPQQLYKNSVIDEDGNTVIEFRNHEGQIVLERKVLNSSENADTYYVYNDYNKIAFIITPKASENIKNIASGTIIPDVVRNDLCYQYSYDKRLRLIEKKLPGRGIEYFIYDRQDRVVATRDANLGDKGQWLYTKYDQFGRVAFTGIFSGGTRVSEQTLADSFISNNVKRTANVFFNREGMDVFYDPNGTYPNVGWVKLMSINYYDSYPSYSFNPTFPANILGTAVVSDSQNNNVNTNNLSVMSLLKNIEDDNWTKTYSYYDAKGRVIGSHSINHLGGYTREESNLDFAGVPQKNITRHKRLDTDTERVITENFDYDSRNRLLVHKHQVDSNPIEILAQNKYNEISQLESKKVGGVDLANPLQKIDYKYNIRGWLTQINDPVNLNGKLFGYEVRYNNPGNPQVVGKFNGAVAEVNWNNASENLLKRYNYEYDKLNRLTNAFYKEPSTGVSGNYDEYLTYDLNGNISNLKRSAIPVSGQTATLVDNLDYIYNGNRLTQVIENALNDTGYEGGNNIIDYDLNGSMTTLKDKGINSIVYNHLSLADSYSITQNNPFGLSMNSGLDYLYRADGIKVRKTYTSAPPRGMASSTITDYLDGFQYNYFEGGGSCITCRTENAYEQQAYKSVFNPIVTPKWNLDFVPTAEGVYSFTENRYIYQYKDHLGNLRVSFAKDSAGNLEVTDTNNYYAFGLSHISGGFSNSYFGGYHSYKYNGKELQETGFFDYGARMYMPDLGRWSAIDPLSEKFFSTSPYTYVANNPISSIDPDGRDIVNIAGGVRFTGSHARMMLRYFQNMTSSGNYNIKGIHFVQETITPNIYRHTLNSFQKGKPELLHYDSDQKRNRQRRQQATYGIATVPGYERDEYPYASTFEGGKQPDGSRAHVMLVPRAENNWQGTRELRPLYRTLKTGDAFLVVPVPKNREMQDVKEEALEKYKTPAPAPVVTTPDFGRPVIPYKMWPVVAGAAVLAAAAWILRTVPVP